MILSKYTPEEMDTARNIDLYDFLLTNYPDLVTHRGNSLRWNDNKSISIKQGYTGYRDFGNDETGGSIKFLMKYLDYSFNEAVDKLLHGGVVVSEPSQSSAQNIPNKPKHFKLPECWPYDTDEIRKYLYEKRHIPLDTIYDLINAGLIYQEHSSHLVLVNYKKTYFQVRRTYGKGPKIIASGHVHTDDFWYLGMSGDTAYICEGAIDAISLYELLGRKHAFYISMGGVSNQAVIDRVVKDGKCKVVLCVDNDDDAGQKCRERNPGLETMIPPAPFHDWNEMLQAGATLDDTSYMRQVG